jgi:hypothetical protein
MSDAKIRRITKLMNELNADGDVKNSGLESSYVQTTHTGNITVTGNTTITDTIQDAQGNVRVLNRNAVDSSPYALPSGSSGKYFVAFGSASTITIDSGDCEQGQIITIFNFLDTDITISWTNMTNGVYIAGDTTNQGTSGSVTLAGKGLVTILNDTADRMILSGNVS